MGSSTFVCRDSSTGRELWSKKVKQAVVSAPCAIDKYLYVGGQDTVHYRIEVETGNEPPFADEARGPIVAAPAVTGTHHFNGSLDGFFYALSAEDGRLLWRFETGPVHHAAAVTRARPRSLVLAGAQKTLDAVHYALEVNVLDDKLEEKVTIHAAVTALPSSWKRTFRPR